MPMPDGSLEALPLLEQAVEQSTQMGLMLSLSLWVTYLSEAYLLAGRLDEATQLAPPCPEP